MSDEPHLAWRAILEPPPRYAYGVEAAVSADSAFVAWRANWDPEPLLRLVDAGTGQEVGRVRAAVLEVIPTARGFVAHDTQAGQGRVERLIVMRARPGGPEIEEQEVERGTSLIGADPEGERLFLFREGHCELRRWHSETPLATWDWYRPGVDWQAGCVWGSPEHGSMVIEALDGSWRRTLDEEAGSSTSVRPVGGGALRLGDHGVRLLKPQGPLVTVLPSTSRLLWAVSVSPDATTARVVLGWKPRRFQVDLDGGRVLASPADAPALARVTPRATTSDVLWHPRQEIVALNDKPRRIDVFATDGTVAAQVPTAGAPRAWLAGGDLLVATGGGPGAALERWHIPAVARLEAPD